MMRRTRWLVTSSTLAVLGLLACDSTNSTIPSAANATRVPTAQTDLGSEISALIASGFSPKGQSTAIAAKWDQVLASLAKEPKTTLKGKLVPGSGGRAELVRTVDFIQKKTGNATPPAGESQGHFVARLVLDMSLYVYSGPSTPVPPVTPGSDVVLKLVQPGTTDTVVTPAKQAAVILPPGSVGEPTVVVITPDTTYYPANCSGPLDTHLCQYPKFYHFNVFPDVKLGVSAKVQVCHVDAGANRLPLADHDRFRIAHEKPANPADYTAGSTIVDNVEVLALTPMFVTNCAADGGTTYVPPISANLTPMGRFTSLAMGLVHRASRLLAPREAYAIDVGGGGFADFFSSFGVVDPASIADLAQSTPTFSLVSTSLTTGGPAQVGAWSIHNVGSGTSAPFTSSVIIATDSLLTTPVATFAAGGAAALVPGSSYAYPTMSITLPPAVVPGTYFIGTSIVPSGADSSGSDNTVSVRVTVSSGAADIAVLTGFSTSVTSIVQGNSLMASGFNVKNVGGLTAGPFTASMVLASDTLLTSVVSSQAIGGPTGLAPSVTYAYGTTPVAISPCVAPGSYFVGPQLHPVSLDADASNDRTSIRISVLADAPPTSQSAGSSSWTAAGAGTVTSQVNPHCANLKYNDVPSGYSQQTFAFTTTAVATTSYSFNWTYTGLHSWFQAYAELEAFANGPDGETVVSLQPSTSVYDFFSFGGSASLPLTAGYTWGIRAKGVHFDSSQILLGTISVADTPPVFIP